MNNKKSKFLYFHGYKSSAENSITYKTIKEHFPNTDCFTFVYELKNPIAILDEKKLFKYDLLIGNSFGGLFASYFGLKYHIPFILINPSIKPSVTLGINDYIDYEKEIEYLIKTELIKRTIPKALIVSKNDEVVDRNIILNTGLQSTGIFVEPNWGHRIPEDELEFNEFIIEPINFIDSSIFI